MIEKIIIDYLIANGIDAYMEMPENPGDDVVIVQKTSSSYTDYVKKATFAIQSYGRTLYDAASNNEIIKDLMLNIVARDDIGACKLNADYNYTNTTTKKYRYQAVFDVVYY